MQRPPTIETDADKAESSESPCHIQSGVALSSSPSKSNIASATSPCSPLPARGISNGSDDYSQQEPPQTPHSCYSFKSQDTGFTNDSVSSAVSGYTIFIWNRLPFGSGFVVPRRYNIPTHILGEMFRTLDRRDSPAQPGRLCYSTLSTAIRGFHEVLSEEGCRGGSLSADVEEALQRLKEQADRHMKKAHYKSIDEALVRWDQSYILNTFKVTLGTKERIFFTFDISEASTWASKIVTWIITLAVVVSIFTFILGSTPQARESFGGWMPVVDVICVSVFTIDYAARLITVPFARMELLDRNFLEDVVVNQLEKIQTLTRYDRLKKFLLSPMGAVDLISVIPFWVELALLDGGLIGLMEDDNDRGGQAQSGILRIFRIIRVIRVFKLGTLTKADLGEDRNMVVQLFMAVLVKARPALQLVGVLVLLALLVFGTLIWFTERGQLFHQDAPDCPHEGLCAEASIRLRQRADGSFETSASPFESIPISFWWVLVTITTVGYGDYSPVTSFGYVVGAATILYGTMVFALPVGIIGTTFSQAYEQFLTEQTMRKMFDAHDEQSGRGNIERSGTLEKITQLGSYMSDPGEPPVLFIEMGIALQHVGIPAGIPPEVMKRWEKELKSISMSFDGVGLLKEHPCELLENWGNPVFSTLREHVISKPMAEQFFAAAKAAWYRMLLHTAQAYEDYILRGQDPCAFTHSLHSPLRASGLISHKHFLDHGSGSMTHLNSSRSQASLASRVGEQTLSRIRSISGDEAKARSPERTISHRSGRSGRSGAPQADGASSYAPSHKSEDDAVKQSI